MGIGFCWPNQTQKQVYKKKNILIAIDYVTKWVEEMALGTNTLTMTTKFIYEFILTWFGYSFTLVSD